MTPWPGERDLRESVRETQKPLPSQRTGPDDCDKYPIRVAVWSDA